MHFDATQQISIFSAFDVAKLALKANLVPFVHGSPGIGKSAVARALAAFFNLKLIDVRITTMEPAEMNGLPDLNGQRATFKAFDVFPLEDEEVPAGYDGWLVFLDEMSSADESRQAAAYKLILDRMVGTRNLHKRVRLMAAGNLADDGAIVNPMSSALISRFAHIVVRPDRQRWINEIALPNKFDSNLISFLEFSPNSFYTFDAKQPDQIYACPRTWEDVDKVMKIATQENPNIKANQLLSDPSINTLVSGLIGRGNAANLRIYFDNFASLPSRKEIEDRPETVEFDRNNPGVMYALTGLVSDIMNEGNIDKMMSLVERMPSDYKIVTLRSAIKRNGMTFINNPAIARWIANNKSLVS